ncbi:unnamed protein product [Timema podura]|uniref:Uncharacterized protein n=1 Tax=Timema podura TaxID=61482 RepID=A0ABN7PRH9_TIMPD|nr:unnamed protein product [Timema podura]
MTSIWSSWKPWRKQLVNNKMSSSRQKNKQRHPIGTSLS